MTSGFAFSARTIDGKEQDLSSYTGKVLLIVNVASACGYTPQYAGLQALYVEYADRGLVVLGFPCDQFGHQEPGTEEEIREFCSTTYAVTFPMFAKIEVNGDDAHPLYAWLEQDRAAAPGGDIRWNFTKFLLDSDGQPVGRYEPDVTPEELRADIERLLPSKG